MSHAARTSGSTSTLARWVSCAGGGAVLFSGLLAGASTTTAAAAAETTTTSVVSSTVNDAVSGSTAGTFAYSSGWRTSAGVAGKYLGNDHYSATKGSSYSFRFTGNTVRLFGAKAPHHGQASVSINGGPAVTIDQYASSRTENTLLFSSATLATGAHTVKVTVKGTKRSGATGTAIAIDRAVTTATVTTVATAPTYALDEQWDGLSTISTSTTPWAKEWHGLADSPVSNGELKIPASGAYHRIYHTERRFGGPGKPIVIRMRKRATNLGSWNGSGTIPSAAIWFRVPKDGVNKDDWRNATSDNDPSTTGPSSSIIRDGIGTNGRIEVMAFDGVASKYVTTGSNYSNKNVGYTAGTERDVTIRGEWISKDRWRWQVWHSAGHDMTKPPVHDWTGYAPHQNDKGFFAFRTDFLDAHYKYVTVQELG